MLRKLALAALSTAALLALSPTIPAHAAGEVLITQAKALAGNVTPGDLPGFPVNITQPGSYKLAGNLTVAADRPGISVDAHDVTIDLDGFRIYGANFATAGIYGSMNSTTIRNGTIALFKSHSIYLTGSFAVIEQMRTVANGGYGIYVAGSSGLIQDNVASSNSSGIYAGSALIQGNVVSRNTGAGISARRSTILGNNITDNGGMGIYGYPSPHQSTALVGYGNNTLVGNNSYGAQVGGDISPLHANACDPAC